jgi:hypothetical protein
MGTKFWKPLGDFVRKALTRSGAVGKEELGFGTTTDSPARAVEFISNRLGAAIS